MSTCKRRPLNFLNNMNPELCTRQLLRPLWLAFLTLAALPALDSCAAHPLPAEVRVVNLPVHLTDTQVDWHQDQIQIKLPQGTVYGIGRVAVASGMQFDWREYPGGEWHWSTSSGRVLDDKFAEICARTVRIDVVRLLLWADGASASVHEVIRKGCSEGMQVHLDIVVGELESTHPGSETVVRFWIWLPPDDSRLRSAASVIDRC